MASEGSPQDLQSFLERLLSSEFRSGPLPFPFLAGLRFAVPSQEPDPEEDGPQMPARFILINPFTQSMAVFERAGTDSNSLFDELFLEKRGRPPASKASIDAMKSIEVSEGEPFDDQCAICLEDWEVGETAKEMPCSHRFHSKCIHKWLTIHGSCPVCRYEMPIEEEEGEKKRSGESGGPRRRGVWISLVVSGDRRNGEENEEGSDHTLNDSESQNQAVQ